MTCTASSSMSRRMSVSGQPSPRMCSLRFSPLPTPKRNRPSRSSDAVAVAWARTAGWMRTVGHVTAGGDGDRRVGRRRWHRSRPTRTGEWPCSSTQGWKWSEMSRSVHPAASARTACCDELLGVRTPRSRGSSRSPWWPPCRSGVGRPYPASSGGCALAGPSFASVPPRIHHGLRRMRTGPVADQMGDPYGLMTYLKAPSSFFWKVS